MLPIHNVSTQVTMRASKLVSSSLAVEKSTQLACDPFVYTYYTMVLFCLKKYTTDSICCIFLAIHTCLLPTMVFSICTVNILIMYYLSSAWAMNYIIIHIYKHKESEMTTELL